MRLLITGDLHLTDKPNDAYRLGIFDWLEQKRRKHKADRVIILGDLTNNKDKHPSRLVNSIVYGLCSIGCPVDVLKGNHDYIDPREPFFEFLNELKGINFIGKSYKQLGMLFVPHTRNEEEFNSAFDTDADYVFIHQTVDGVISESGRKLTGFSTKRIEKLAPIYGCYAGDIHKPQMVGPVVYVGSPYNIRFGDNYEPRIILLDGDVVQEMSFPSPRKWSLSVNDPLDITNNDDLLPEDHVKLTVKLTREEKVEWKQIRRNILEACKAKELVVYGIEVNLSGERKRIKSFTSKSRSDAEILTAFSNAENLSSEIRRAGLKLVGGTDVLPSGDMA